VFSPPIIVCREGAAAESARAGQGLEERLPALPEVPQIVPAGDIQGLAAEQLPALFNAIFHAAAHPGLFFV